MALCGSMAMAQGDEKVNLRLEVRGDLQYENVEGHTIDGTTGFRGKQLNLRLNGNINDSKVLIDFQKANTLTANDY